MKKLKKLSALFMVLLLLLSFLPVSVLADTPYIVQELLDTTVTVDRPMHTADDYSDMFDGNESTYCSRHNKDNMGYEKNVGDFTFITKVNTATPITGFYLKSSKWRDMVNDQFTYPGRLTLSGSNDYNSTAKTGTWTPLWQSQPGEKLLLLGWKDISAPTTDTYLYFKWEFVSDGTDYASVFTFDEIYLFNCVHNWQTRTTANFTCQLDGTTEEYCTECGFVKSRGTVPKAHSPKDGEMTCKFCNQALAVQIGEQYYISIAEATASQNAEKKLLKNHEETITDWNFTDGVNKYKFDLNGFLLNAGTDTIDGQPSPTSSDAPYFTIRDTSGGSEEHRVSKTADGSYKPDENGMETISGGLFTGSLGNFKLELNNVTFIGKIESYVAPQLTNSTFIGTSAAMPSLGSKSTLIGPVAQDYVNISAHSQAEQLRFRNGDEIWAVQRLNVAAAEEALVVKPVVSPFEGAAWYKDAARTEEFNFATEKLRGRFDEENNLYGWDLYAGQKYHAKITPAGGGDAVYYETTDEALTEAAKAANNGCTVTLLSDVDALSISSGSFTLDAADKTVNTLVLNASSNITISGGSFGTVTFSAGAGGTVTGGTFKKITADKKLSAYVKEGDAFRLNGASWVDGELKTAGNGTTDRMTVAAAPIKKVEIRLTELYPNYKDGVSGMPDETWNYDYAGSPTYEWSLVGNNQTYSYTTWEFYERPLEIGEYTLTLKVTVTPTRYPDGLSGAYTLTATKTFSVEKTDPSYPVPTGMPAEYGDTLADVTLQDVTSSTYYTPGTLSWEDPVTTPVGEIGTNSFNLTFTPTDAAHYKTVTGIGATIAVEKATPRVGAAPTARLRSGQTLAEAAIQPGTMLDKQGNTISGTFTWNEPTKTITGSSTETMTFTPTDTVHYKSVTDVSAAVSLYSSGKSRVTTFYTVSFETNGGSRVYSQEVIAGNAAKEPDAPKKEDCTFAGWYGDSSLTVPYDFKSAVTKSITLYAKWTEDGSGNDSENQNENQNGDNSGGTAETLPFTDVKKGDWFYESVREMYTRGLMNGVTETRFAPNEPLTRAMAVTILYRAAGEPAVETTAAFTDVAAESYYAEAVAWAQANGIISGMTETEFAPEENITREQIAAILYRFAKLMGYDTSVGEDTNILSYTDYDTISEYAVAALQYAVGAGVMTGKTDSTLNPKDLATRAEFAAMLSRVLKVES